MKLLGVRRPTALVTTVAPLRVTADHEFRRRARCRNGIEMSHEVARSGSRAGLGEVGGVVHGVRADRAIRELRFDGAHKRSTRDAEAGKFPGAASERDVHIRTRRGRGHSGGKRHCGGGDSKCSNGIGDQASLHGESLWVRGRSIETNHNRCDVPFTGSFNI